MSEALLIIQQQVEAEFGIDKRDAWKHAKAILHALSAAGYEIVRVPASAKAAPSAGDPGGIIEYDPRDGTPTPPSDASRSVATSGYSPEPPTPISDGKCGSCRWWGSVGETGSARSCHWPRPFYMPVNLSGATAPIHGFCPAWAAKP